MPVTLKDGSDNPGLQAYPELKIIASSRLSLPATPGRDIMQWITQQYKRSTGFEIGTLNPSLLPSLFLEQSQYWKHFAYRHVEDVFEISIISITKRFNTAAKMRY
jgi:hypothetical protein